MVVADGRVWVTRLVTGSLWARTKREMNRESERSVPSDFRFACSCRHLQPGNGKAHHPLTTFRHPPPAASCSPLRRRLRHKPLTSCHLDRCAALKAFSNFGSMSTGYCQKVAVSRLLRALTGYMVSSLSCSLTIRRASHWPPG